MSNMILGTYTFARQPNKMTFLQKDRIVAHVETYTGVALFSWGATYVGKVVEIGWNSMSSSQYKSQQDIFLADIPVEFNPNDGEGKTFNVEVLGLTGEYHVHLSNATGHQRKNVRMTLLILSEVS